MPLKNLTDFCASQKALSFYLYDLGALEDRVHFFKGLFPEYFKIHFAVKSNFHPRFLRQIANAGVGADVVSAGEVSRAMESGFSADKIIFSGVGKTTAEIEMALDANVHQLNVESLPELERIARIASAKNKTARVALRVNPNVDAETHPYIRTGILENKFGVDFDLADEILKNSKKYEPHVKIVGFTMHIGSQILDTSPFFEAAEKVIELYLKHKKDHPHLEVLDLGGGLGLDYQVQNDRDAEAQDKERAQVYAKGLLTLVDPLVQSGQLKSVYLEPGRFLSARAGYLFTQVQYIKTSSHKNFVIVDTGMHHLMRPSLYKAYHRIQSLNQFMGKNSEVATFDIVGPICESSDSLGFSRELPKDLKEGDWLVIREAGAYASVMASDYNLRERAPEYFAKEGDIV